MNAFAQSDTSHTDYQGLFFDYLVRQQFTWFGHQQQQVTAGAIETKLSERLELAMQQSSQNPARLLFVRLTLGEQLPGMLDLVMDQSDTDDSMRRAVNSESWLSKELLQWVNAPRFRQITGSHNDFVTSLDEALAEFNGKMLARQLIEFAMVQAAAREARFCKLLNRRILEWSQELAQCAAALAHERGLCAATVSMASLVQGLAPLAISQNFVHLFDGQIKLALEKARDSGQKQAYDQLNSIKPPVRVLLAHLTRSTGLQHALLAELGATGKLLASLTREVDADLPVEQLSELAQVIRQARGYSQYRWLNDACVLTPHQSHMLLSELALSEHDLTTLSRLRRR
ncbi:hypothetical protein [Echinimonas agarilytica]|uniref:HDOD domain-containing protein n=1 Tax=Echinimonas agarilytica TaxID=1215918 RepID=A0AA41W405_9GAMM|nr:hypothetical protein [Echinimonas agarilytica]MCM2678377.1 hypothetical protein [Echinimonas agarilytica]